VVNISTVGTSAIIGPRGVTLDRLPVYTEGYMLEDVPLSQTLTPATVLGRSLETTIIVFTFFRAFSSPFFGLGSGNSGVNDSSTPRAGCA